jgi:zinc D-Ala-D-Ala carboxypeptidase
LADKNRPETDDESVFEGTPASKWLFQNAYRFNFELSFPENNWQGIGYEPWHWRFVGDEKSKRIFYPNMFRKVFQLARSALKSILARIN